MVSLSLQLLFLFSLLRHTIPSLVQEQPLVFKYHNGALLKGNITVNLIWYGDFTPVQRSIITDFVKSLSFKSAPPPSAASWWKTTKSYTGGPTILSVGRHIIQRNQTQRVLTSSDLSRLASKARVGPGSINVLLTGKEVPVERFCSSRCGTHGSISPARARRHRPAKPRLAVDGGRTEQKVVPVGSMAEDSKVAGNQVAEVAGDHVAVPRAAEKVAEEVVGGTYIWVGNAEAQCPGHCAWPFHQPIYGPQTRPLTPPNGDVGIDGMVINLATLLVNTVTNPHNTGYFQGPADAPLEAVSACTGIFGLDSYPGNPGRVSVDKVTGGSYNANGIGGRKFLVPAMWDRLSSTCKASW